MKKMRLFIGFFLISFVIANNVFAKPSEPTPYNSFYTTDANQNSKSVFKWNEEPFLYVQHINGANFDSNDLKIKAHLYSPNNYTYSGGYDDVTGNTMWMSLSQWLNDVSWEDMVSEGGTGTWRIEANTTRHGQGNALYSGTTTFVVGAVPEPISATLFLLGGATLALRQYRKKKQKL